MTVLKHKATHLRTLAPTPSDRSNSRFETPIWMDDMDNDGDGNQESRLREDQDPVSSSTAAGGAGAGGGGGAGAGGGGAASTGGGGAAAGGAASTGGGGGGAGAGASTGGAATGGSVCYITSADDVVDFHDVPCSTAAPLALIPAGTQLTGVNPSADLNIQMLPDDGSCAIGELEWINVAFTVNGQSQNGWVSAALVWVLDACNPSPTQTTLPAGTTAGSDAPDEDPFDWGTGLASSQPVPLGSTGFTEFLPQIEAVFSQLSTGAEVSNQELVLAFGAASATAPAAAAATPAGGASSSTAAATTNTPGGQLLEEGEGSEDRAKAPMFAGLPLCYRVGSAGATLFKTSGCGKNDIIRALSEGEVLTPQDDPADRASDGSCAVLMYSVQANKDSAKGFVRSDHVTTKQFCPDSSGPHTCSFTATEPLMCVRITASTPLLSLCGAKVADLLLNDIVVKRADPPAQTDNPCTLPIPGIVDTSVNPTKQPLTSAGGFVPVKKGGVWGWLQASSASTTFKCNGDGWLGQGVDTQSFFNTYGFNVINMDCTHLPPPKNKDTGVPDPDGTTGAFDLDGSVPMSPNKFLLHTLGGDEKELDKTQNLGFDSGSTQLKLNGNWPHFIVGRMKHPKGTQVIVGQFVSMYNWARAVGHLKSGDSGNKLGTIQVEIEGLPRFPFTKEDPDITAVVKSLYKAVSDYTGIPMCVDSRVFFDKYPSLSPTVADDDFKALHGVVGHMHLSNQKGKVDPGFIDPFLIMTEPPASAPASP